MSDNDNVPVFDRGKDYFPPDPFNTEVPVPSEDTPIRQCRTCETTFSLAEVEIGYIDQWGEALFFCSDNCKVKFRRNADDEPEDMQWRTEAYDGGLGTGFPDDDLWHPERYTDYE